MGKWELVKTTSDAMREQLRRNLDDFSNKRPVARLWIGAFGGLRKLQKETKRINRILQEEFEQVEEDERR